MANDTNTIRKSGNEVSILGEVLSITPQEIKTKSNPPKIGRKLAVEIDTGNDNIITAEMFSMELKSDGNPNDFYKGLLTVEEEYKGRNDEGNNDGGTIVAIKSNSRYSGATLGLNEYVGKDGKLKSFFKVDVANMSRAKDSDKVDENGKAIPYGTKFSLEGRIVSLKPEIVATEETGVLLIELATYNYKGELLPFELRVENPQYVEAIQSMYSVGQTAIFHGEIVVQTKKEVIEKEVAFGEPEVEVIESFKSGLVVSGGGVPIDEGEVNSYTKEVYDISLGEREKKIEALFNKSKESKPKQGVFGESNLNPTSYGKGDMDDIPF